MMTRTLLILTAAALLAGCEKPASKAAAGPANPLITAKVDTATILQADPEYQVNAEKYMKEQVELEGKFFGRFKSAREEKDEDKKKEVAAAYNDARNKLEEKWNKKTAEFLQSRHDKLKAAAEQVAKDQKIDLIVVDSKQYPSVEYGATDITQEVMMRLAGSDNKTPAPQESKR